MTMDFYDAQFSGADVSEPVRGVIRLVAEHLLFSLLDEDMNANGIVPQVAGYDAHGIPFFAWLDEEGGDCVGLRVIRLLEDDGGTSSTPSAVEFPKQGETTSLVYPIRVLERALS